MFLSPGTSHILTIIWEESPKLLLISAVLRKMDVSSGSAHIKPYLKCSSQENRARWDRELRCKILRSSCHLTLDLT